MSRKVCRTLASDPKNLCHRYQYPVVCREIFQGSLATWSMSIRAAIPKFNYYLNTDCGYQNLHHLEASKYLGFLEVFLESFSCLLFQLDTSESFKLDALGSGQLDCILGQECSETVLVGKNSCKDKLFLMALYNYIQILDLCQQGVIRNPWLTILHTSLL